MPYVTKPLSVAMLNEVINDSLIEHKYFHNSVKEARKDGAPEELTAFMLKVHEMKDDEILSNEPDEAGQTRFIFKKIYGGVHLVTIGTHFSDMSIDNASGFVEVTESVGATNAECQAQTFVYHSAAGVSAVAEAAGTFNPELVKAREQSMQELLHKLIEEQKES